MTVKCPWCGKLVPYHKGRLKPHIVHKGRQCVGNGQTSETVEQIRASHQQREGIDRNE